MREQPDTVAPLDLEIEYSILEIFKKNSNSELHLF